MLNSSIHQHALHMGAASPSGHQYHHTATSTPACTQGLTEDDQPEEAEEDGRDERDSYGEEDHNSEEEEREQQRRRRHMTDIAPQFLADRQQVIEDKVRWGLWVVGEKGRAAMECYCLICSDQSEGFGRGCFG